MLDKLKSVYKNHLVTVGETEDLESYQWYTQADGTVFGIEKNILTEQEKNLLETFLQPQTVNLRKLTVQEQRWRNFLDGKAETPPFLPARCVYFSLSEKIDDEQEMKEALSGMLPYPFVLLWNGAKEGVIIEHFSSIEEVSYHSIIDTFTSDFFLSMKLLIGKVYYSPTSIRSHLALEKECQKIVATLDQKTKVYSYQAILPLLLLKNAVTKEQFTDFVLGDVKREQDLLTTIKVFLQSNQNVTMVAKKQYMHRNSVQYRVDKFIEKTGIDIKTFSGAALVHLAFLCMDEIL